MTDFVRKNLAKLNFSQRVAHAEKQMKNRLAKNKVK